jgi:hypothetical protein
VTVRTGDMGNFWTERIFEWFEHARLQIEVSQIIMHKADQPGVVLRGGIIKTLAR